MKALILNVLACMSLASIATVQISNLRAQQRYPWNGKVDITFDVVSDEDATGMISVRAFDENQKQTIRMKTLTIEGVNDQYLFDHLGKYPFTRLNGSHTFVWDSSADYRDTGATSVSYEISVQRAKQNVLDALGEPNGIVGDVAVIDLETLMLDQVTTNPISIYPSVDLGRFNCDTYKTSKMVFVKISAGEYVVGEGEIALSPVTLTKDYWFGLFPVTRAQYLAVMGSDPSTTGADSEGVLAPAGNMSWSGVTTGFLAQMNDKIQMAGGAFQIRLPTEAQWEIAARAGTTTKWFFGAADTLLGQYSWYYSNTWNRLRTVGTRKPNPWGLYDVYGNANEWCSDMLSTTYPSSEIDPIGALSNSNYIFRGGCARGDSNACRSGKRDCWTSTGSGPAFGFRASLVPTIP